MIGDNKMDNIFTPEEANAPVTYETLLKILNGFLPTIGSSDRMIMSLDSTIKTIGDTLADAEYKRIRDIRFILSYLAANHLYHRDKLYDMYEEWCKEFDKLNKPQNNPEDTND